MRRYAGRHNGGVSELYKACCRCKISISGKEIARRIAVKITPSCCPQRETANNQSVRRHLDAFTRGRIIGKLEEGRSETSVAAEFELLTASFHDFGTISNYRNSYPGFSSGRPRGTTPADDRYIVLQARRNRRQTGEKSLDTRHR
ncbi:transposable element Tc1 transposase [Trichonephila clavipes]|nr:transposable element Tc1 transposase [Trichonephila clavipes]